MKTLTIAIMLALSAPASAQTYNSTRLGDTTITRGPDGYRSTTIDSGDYRFYRDNEGTRCTTVYLGSSAHTSCH